MQAITDALLVMQCTGHASSISRPRSRKLGDPRSLQELKLKRRANDGQLTSHSALRYVTTSLQGRVRLVSTRRAPVRSAAIHHPRTTPLILSCIVLLIACTPKPRQ